MKLEEHCAESIKLFGEPFVHVHLWLDESSVKNFDWIALRYNKETDNAPWVRISKASYYTPKTDIEFNKAIQKVKQLASDHGMFIYSNMEQKEYPSKKLNLLIKSIRKSCIGENKTNQLSEDLYRPVAFIYAACYFYHEEKGIPV